MPESFGDRLKALRKERKMSQEEIATLLDTSKQVISRYETNQRTPKITVVNEYAQKLNVPLNVLLGEPADIKKESIMALDDELLTALQERPLLRRFVENLTKMDDESIKAFATIAGLKDPPGGK